MAGFSEKVGRSLAVLRSFIGAVNLTVHDITIGIDIDPEEGSADSGDLEIFLPILLCFLRLILEHTRLLAFLYSVEY